MYIVKQLFYHPYRNIATAISIIEHIDSKLYNIRYIFQPIYSTILPYVFIKGGKLKGLPKPTGEATRQNNKILLKFFVRYCIKNREILMTRISQVFFSLPNRLLGGIRYYICALYPRFQHRNTHYFILKLLERFINTVFQRTYMSRTDSAKGRDSTVNPSETTNKQEKGGATRWSPSLIFTAPPRAYTATEWSIIIGGNQAP